MGNASSLNDINVLDKSSIIGAMLSGELDLTMNPYTLNNGDVYDHAYFLADGIYPEWAIFVKTYSESTQPKQRYFAKKQEEVRKDIECAFGILVQQFQVLQRPLRNWFLDDLTNVVYCCVLMHNMITDELYGPLSPLKL